MKRKPKSTGDGLALLGLPEGSYLIVRPHPPQRPGTPLSPLGMAHRVFPPQGLGSYSRAQALRTLFDMNSDWLFNSGWPPPALAPWLEPVPEEKKKRKKEKQVERPPGLRSDASYTLRELVERFLRAQARARGTSFRAFMRGVLVHHLWNDTLLNTCLPAVRQSVESV